MTDNLKEAAELIKTSKSHRDIYIFGLLCGLRDSHHDVDFCHEAIIALIEDWIKDPNER